MKNFRFIIILVIVLGGFVMLYLFTSSPNSAELRPGLAQNDEGREHIPASTAVSYKNAIPTSGSHSQPAQWGISSIQINDESLVHNMEHGGVVISYRTDTDAKIVSQLKKLFSKPYSNSGFRPTKAIVMPRKGQEAPIVAASWQRLKKFQTYNEQEIIEYYNLNIGKSPEPSSG